MTTGVIIEADSALVSMYTIARSRCRAHRLCPRHFAYSRPCRAQLGGGRVYRAAREGPESVTKLPQAVRKGCAVWTPAGHHVVHAHGVGGECVARGSWCRRRGRKTTEVGNIALGSKAQAVEMLMIAPPFWARMMGATKRVTRRRK
jgi:hypothetical protein